MKRKRISSISVAQNKVNKKWDISGGVTCQRLDTDLSQRGCTVTSIDWQYERVRHPSSVETNIAIRFVRIRMIKYLGRARSDGKSYQFHHVFRRPLWPGITPLFLPIRHGVAINIVSVEYRLDVLLVQLYVFEALASGAFCISLQRSGR